jgi:hypothetical protein
VNIFNYAYEVKQKVCKCQQNTPFITVKESIFDVEDVAVDLTISGTKLVPPVVTVSPLALKNTIGAEKT